MLSAIAHTFLRVSRTEYGGLCQRSTKYTERHPNKVDLKNIPPPECQQTFLRVSRTEYVSCKMKCLIPQSLIMRLLFCRRFIWLCCTGNHVLLFSRPSMRLHEGPLIHCVEYCAFWRTTSVVVHQDKCVAITVDWIVLVCVGVGINDGTCQRKCQDRYTLKRATAGSEHMHSRRSVTAKSRK